MSVLHRRFVCKFCGRQLGGCPKDCPAPDHKTEEVESCAVCSRVKGEKPEVFPSKSMEKRVKMSRSAAKTETPDGTLW